MEELEIWLCDGEKNTIALFLNDENPAREGWACLTRDCETNIFVQLTPPFAVEGLVLRARGAPPTLSQQLDRIVADLDGQSESEEETFFVDSDDVDDLQKRIDSTNSKQAAITQFEVSSLKKSAVDRILTDLVSLRDKPHDGWRAAPIGRNLAVWVVELFGFEQGTNLEKDFQVSSQRGGASVIEMEIRFPADYPFKPPFLRVVRPRFQFRTGRVTVGGSICTELLTDEGWNPTYDVESLIISVRAQMLDVDAGARIDLSRLGDSYTLNEAEEAFARVALHHKTHGW